MFLHRRELHVLNKCAAGAKVEGFTMRLMALVISAGLLWSVSTFAQEDRTSSRNYLTGTKLYEICTSTSSDLCLGYVMGVSDALNLSTFKQNNIFCSPTSVSAHQELAVVIKYLRDHPDTWHYSGASDIGVALAMAFPCKEQAH
jgi:hypothetical protein